MTKHYPFQQMIALLRLEHRHGIGMLDVRLSKMCPYRRTDDWIVWFSDDSALHLSYDGRYLTLPVWRDGTTEGGLAAQVFGENREFR